MPLTGNEEEWNEVINSSYHSNCRILYVPNYPTNGQYIVTQYKKLGALPGDFVFIGTD